MSVLSEPRFHDEAKAFEYLESIVWANGVACPHCGVVGGRVYILSGVRSKSSKKSPGGAIRHGLKKCGECHKQFTVKVGTCFEHARLPLHQMLQAAYLMASSKKGMSSHQLHRILGITYRSAWFLAHRIREAMRSDDHEPFGGEGSVVEVDETFIGRKKGAEKKRAYHHKMKVLALVDRTTGLSRAMVIDNTSMAHIVPIVRRNVAAETHIMTDDANQYRFLARDFAAHDVVLHGQGEYGRGPIHTNTIEGYFSIFKRGMKGVYQHCGEQHLHRYLAEFDFRYSHRAAKGFDDRARAVEGLRGIVGKRLRYRAVVGRWAKN